jgi:medium-chain acyl-[acyl-carrier-protein] hydrolase
MTSAPIPNAWVTCPTPRPQARMRLFCLPFAGGGATVYRPWAKSVPPEVELCPVQLPGRESRFREPPFTQAAPLAAALATAIAPWLTLPFALFGHSLGAMVSFELTRELRRRGAPAPVHLLVSARRAPHIPTPDPMHHLPEAQFIERLRGMEGTPEAVLKEPELLALFLPILRADLSVNDTYIADAGAPLDIPISVFGGTEDPRASPDELDAWRQHTTSDFSLQIFPGGHFYFKNDPEPLLNAMSQTLDRAVARLPKVAYP